MSKVLVLILAAVCSASVVHAQQAPDAVIDSFIRGHQQTCVAGVNRQLDASVYRLPFGFVENFCACMGEGLYGKMSVAQQREFAALPAGELPASIAALQAPTRERCANSITEMYVADGW